MFTVDVKQQINNNNEHCSHRGGDGVSISAVSIKSIEKTTVVVYVINVPTVEEVDLDVILPAVTV